MFIRVLRNERRRPKREVRGRREKQEDIQGERQHFEDGGRHPGAKQSRWPPDTETGKGAGSPPEPSERNTALLLS